MQLRYIKQSTDIKIYVDGPPNIRKTPDFNKGRGSWQNWFFLGYDFFNQKHTI
jgi:hypothetical protein